MKFIKALTEMFGRPESVTQKSLDKHIREINAEITANRKLSGLPPYDEKRMIEEIFFKLTKPEQDYIFDQVDALK